MLAALTLSLALMTPLAPLTNSMVNDWQYSTGTWRIKVGGPKIKSRTWHSTRALDRALALRQNYWYCGRSMEKVVQLSTTSIALIHKLTDTHTHTHTAAKVINYLCGLHLS